MMFKLLVLAQDIQSAKQILEGLDVPKLYTIDQDQVRQQTGMIADPDSIGYEHLIVGKLAALTNAFKAARPLAVIVDMRYRSAIERIPHDVNCLIYDGSLNKRLAYNVKYATMIRIKGAGDTEALESALERFRVGQV